MSPSGPALRAPFSGVAGTRVEDSLDRASFRLIIGYEIGTDSLYCRLDVKAGELQHGREFYIEQRDPVPGKPISRADPLIEPKGVFVAKALIADRTALVSALRDLANELGNMRPAAS